MPNILKILPKNTYISWLHVDLVSTDLSILVRVVRRAPPHLNCAGVDWPREDIPRLPRNCKSDTNTFNNGTQVGLNDSVSDVL